MAKRIRRFSLINTRLFFHRRSKGKLRYRLILPSGSLAASTATRVSRTGKRLSVLFILVLVGCHSTAATEIVRQVELAGSGDVKQIQAESLMNFLDHHARLAVRIESLCVPKRQASDVDWMISDEGKVCQAVASRDRVKYLNNLETMKRMDMQYGDQNAAATIDQAEGK
jgi:hypothetical protein